MSNVNMNGLRAGLVYTPDLRDQAQAIERMLRFLDCEFIGISELFAAHGLLEQYDGGDRKYDDALIILVGYTLGLPSKGQSTEAFDLLARIILESEHEESPVISLLFRNDQQRAPSTGEDGTLWDFRNRLARPSRSARTFRTLAEAVNEVSLVLERTNRFSEERLRAARGIATFGSTGAGEGPTSEEPAEVLSSPPSVQQVSNDPPLGNTDILTLAWRLVAARTQGADPELLQHLHGEQLKKSVDAMLVEIKSDGSRAKQLSTALEHLASTQQSLRPDPLWLAWMQTFNAAVIEQASHVVHAETSGAPPAPAAAAPRLKRKQRAEQAYEQLKTKFLK